jgi:hypothetical protein
VFNRFIVLLEGTRTLVAILKDRRYRCHELSMTESLKAGAPVNA